MIAQVRVSCEETEVHEGALFKTEREIPSRTQCFTTTFLQGYSFLSAIASSVFVYFIICLLIYTFASAGLTLWTSACILELKTEKALLSTTSENVGVLHERLALAC